ncbi:hypothetical protein Tco_0838832 [Tanacetum coccineum]|uniref:Uncharacterized protein n=1 Tax=Tanacetum coccineum TaxID=301880 RepID=A0ABQ5ANY9_9ASTR
MLAEEEATKAALSNEYEFIQARLNADKILAKKLQEEERERCKKHSDLKTKSFDEIQVLYEKIKRSDDSFIAIGFAKDEKVIKEMNEQAVDASKKRVKKDDSVKGEIKEEEGTRKRKLGKRSEYLTTKPQHDETKEIEDVYLNVVIRSNRQRRYFSTLMAVLSILDRDDICDIYQLVMSRYQDETPKGFDKILWGDLMIIFNQSNHDEFWNA